MTVHDACGVVRRKNTGSVQNIQQIQLWGKALRKQEYILCIGWWGCVHHQQEHMVNKTHGQQNTWSTKHIRF